MPRWENHQKIPMPIAHELRFRLRDLGKQIVFLKDWFSLGGGLDQLRDQQGHGITADWAESAVWIARPECHRMVRSAWDYVIGVSSTVSWD